MKQDKVTPDDKAIIVVDQNQITEELPILPLSNQVAFPTLNMSLRVTLRATSLVETAMKGSRLIGVVGTRLETESVPLSAQVYEIGTVVQILYMSRAPDNTVLLIVQGLKRFRIAEWITGSDFLRAKIKLIPEFAEKDIETDALHRALRELTQEVFSLSLDVPSEAIDGLARIKDSLHLAYIAAANSEIDHKSQQALLEEDSLKAKLRELVKLLSREKDVLSLGKKIKSDAHDEMNKSQKDYYLRQQLKAIKKELGELDDNESDPNDYRQRIDESDMTDEARKEALREWDRMEEMSPQSAEYAI